MPTWGQILQELKALTIAGAVPHGTNAFDVLRRRYLQTLAQKTGRNVILYATRWTQGDGDPQLTSITPEDVQGFMEVINGLSGDSLDIIVHSPGGSAEATDALVKYLRSKFNDIRVIVPHAAMSAAAMLACSSNRIMMGKHSFLGPIDPQIIMQTELGGRTMPAYAIIEQFEYAIKEVQRDNSLLPAWLPLLRQYGPALIIQCRLHQQLAVDLVSAWLTQYMLKGDSAKANDIAQKLSNHAAFKSHSRFISKDEARALGLVIENLEDDQELQDVVLSVFHAATHVFSATGTAKIIENHLGKAFVKVQAQEIVMLPQQMLPSMPGMPAPPPITPTNLVE